MSRAATPGGVVRLTFKAAGKPCLIFPYKYGEPDTDTLALVMPRFRNEY